MNLDSYNVAELNHNDVVETNGGFFPIIIGIYALDAVWTGAIFLAGIGVGAAVAQGQKK